MTKISSLKWLFFRKNRSGLALKQGINILAGVIDCDYRGEVGIILHNTTDNIISVDLNKPIAQLILERATLTNKCMVVDELESTERGAGGFGSSDVPVKQTKAICLHNNSQADNYGVCSDCGESSPRSIK